MSLKVTAEYTSNHKDVEVPVTQDSLDKETDLETLIINYPFTFYVTDVRSKIVLAAGKVVELEQLKFNTDDDTSENGL
jgi:serine protease inhibitor